MEDLGLTRSRDWTLYGRLAAVAARNPEAIALVAPGRAPLTYGALAAEIEDIGDTLAALGLGRDDRVALALPQGPEAAVAVLAVAARSACAPLNPAHLPSEVDGQLRALNARALVVSTEAESPARSVAEARGIPLVELRPAIDRQAGGLSLHGRLALRGRDRTDPLAPGWARPDDVAVLLQTSGTTSRPKVVPLTHANLLASAQNIRHALGLAEADRCLDLMPLFHIHGLMTLLSSLSSGGSVVLPPAFDVARVFGWMDECHPTWYTGVPPIHRAILDQAVLHADVIARRPLRFIRSSSAPLPLRLGAELERVFGAPVIESYGMTEAAHQVASNPLPPAARKPGSVGVAAGPDIAILDESGRPVSPGETGEIVIRGAQVMGGYDDAPTENRAAFIDGWLRTGDRGFLDADGYLFITGRLKDIINRGGEKISPREIDDVLLEHPAVAQAATFAVAHPTLGEDVAAAVVLRHDSESSEAALRQFAASRVALFKVPSRVVIVDEIPKNATGKVDRAALPAALGLARPERAQPDAGDVVGPRTPTEEIVAAVWRQVLQLPHVGPDDNFFALGGDSIRATLIASRLRDALSVALPLRRIFETPTVGGLAETLDSARLAGTRARIAPISRVSRDGRLLLSFAQERLWFLDQLDPGASQYNHVTALRLTGPLDGRALDQSLAEIRRRHEALRTIFPVVDGRPGAVVVPVQPSPLPVVDLRELPEPEREARLRQLINEEARRPFDLAHGPLFRAALLRLSDREAVLLLTLHHIVTDGWSTAVLNRELSTLYRAFTRGEPSPLSELPIQYVDFASWQRQWLSGQILGDHLAYWTRDLAGSPAKLNLPADRRPAGPNAPGASQSFALPTPLTQALRALSRREGVTLFMMLLAAFAALLHRYSGQDDIVVGTPVAGRTRVEIEGLIGFFANTLVLRADLSGDPTFRELLGRVRDRALGAYTWQELPFEKLVEAIHPTREGQRTPLFQVMFALQDSPGSVLNLPDLTVRPLIPEGGPAKFDLTLWMTEERTDLRGLAEYDTGLFDAGTIARLLAHFRILLDGVVAHPEARVSHVPLLTDAERHQIVVGWNDTRTDYPRDACVHERFGMQARRTPDAVAIVSGDERVTYQELDRRANQLAHRLRRLGVGPDVLVGICVERSVEMVVGLLGVLKAGGAYVPLDPEYPGDRLRFMLDDTGVRILLTQGRLRDARPPAATTICLDTDWRSIAGEPDTDLPSAVSADHLAYVMYTSGSTGRPKGVLIPHRGVLRLLVGQRYVTLDARETLLQLAPIAFDASTFELWGALLHGARCVLFPAEMPTPDRLGAVIAQQRVTTLWLTASLFNSVIDEAPATLAPIRQLLIGGEALSVPHVRRALALLPDTTIVNGYGPTESTTFTCCYAIPRVLDPDLASIPIGRPIANTEVYVADAHLNPVPVGVPGQVLIGGAGLARGYLNRPELTAEKFIPHPWSAAPGARLYTTGDLARYRADGTLEFLGRLDDQLKIRGFRVEPGEIEAVLGRCPGVRQSVVMPWDRVTGDSRLVAYVVATPGAAATAAELRSALAQTLPGYMIPSAFVRLDALPLTPNGKVDLRALPPPASGDVGVEGDFVTPRTPVEEALARIWADLLGLERVGVHAGFFALGGHSLLATRVVARVREEFGVDLPLRRMFETPTVAGLAVAVAQALAARVDHAELARVLSELEQLSDEEARRRLADSGGDGSPAWS